MDTDTEPRALNECHRIRTRLELPKSPPPPFPAPPAAWHPDKGQIDFINPDLDSRPTWEFHFSVMDDHTLVLHKPDGKAFHTFEFKGVEHPYFLFRQGGTDKTFAAEVYELLGQSGPPYECRRPIPAPNPEEEIDHNRPPHAGHHDNPPRPHGTFQRHTQQVDLYHPISQPIPLPEDAVFGAQPPNKLHMWEGTSLANP